MEKFSKKTEFVANLLIIITAVLLIGITIHGYFGNSEVSTNKPSVRIQPTVGKKLNLEKVNFAENPKTVVLALQTTCRFCNESAPFYKRLLEETKGKNVKFIAVFPTSVEDSQKHLTQLGITGFEVQQAPISQLDASGTPTLILTNSRGEVEKFWVGKLPQDKESEAINSINTL